MFLHSHDIFTLSLFTYILICMWSSDLFIYIKIPTTLLFFRLSSPNSPSLFSQERCISPFSIFVALCWTFSVMSMVSLLWAWSRELFSKCVQCWTENNGHLPWLIGNALPKADEDTGRLLCGKGTLQAHEYNFFQICSDLIIKTVSSKPKAVVVYNSNIGCKLKF